LHKADRMSAADPEDGRITPLFHPLQQWWPEHFVMGEAGDCRGLTPVGRATAQAL